MNVNTWTRGGAAWNLWAGELCARVWRVAVEAGEPDEWRWCISRTAYRQGVIGRVRVKGRVLQTGQAKTAELGRDEVDRALHARRFQGKR